MEDVSKSEAIDAQNAEVAAQRQAEGGRGMPTPVDHETNLTPTPTGRTIDGEVEPIVVKMGDGPGESNKLAVAIAEHFGTTPEALTGFVAAVEYGNEQGVTLSSVWSLGVPAWRLRSFAAELQKHLDQLDKA